MGCHTWFSRPITEEEFEWMREYALEDAQNLFGDTKENREECPSCIEPYNISLIERSLKNDEACYYGMTWYEAGFGRGNPKFIEKNKIEPYTIIFKDRGQKGRKSVYIDVAFDIDYATKLYGFSSHAEFEASNLWKTVDFPWFHDVFRIGNYPNKTIYSRHELRRYLRKRYFELTEYQLERISAFFRIYPGGVISFG